MNNNCIMVLNPYWYNGTWVFDDKNHNLTKEAFVAGADKIISKMVESLKIDNAKNGFKLIFSKIPFPDYSVKLTRISHGDGRLGTSYQSQNGDIGWLCPALLHYFPEPPSEIFIGAENLE